jgi:hypothetical protein
MLKVIDSFIKFIIFPLLVGVILFELQRNDQKTYKVLQINIL